MATHFPDPAELARTHGRRVRLKSETAARVRNGLRPHARTNSAGDRSGPERGKILYATTVHAPAPGFKKRTPYVIALIELNDGRRTFCHLVEGTSQKKGTKVESVVRKLLDRDDGGPIVYAAAFREIIGKTSKSR